MRIALGGGEGRRPGGARLLWSAEAAGIRRWSWSSDGKPWQTESEGCAVPREYWDGLQGAKGSMGPVSLMRYVRDRADLTCSVPEEWRFGGERYRVRRNHRLAHPASEAAKAFHWKRRGHHGGSTARNSEPC